MAANIKTTLNGNAATELLGISRDDLSAGDVVKCVSADAAMTEGGYVWSLAYVPSDGSGLSEAALVVDGNKCEFTVDKEGPYLVSLVIDPGTEHEDQQYLRLRALTATAGLRLIAAGEQITDDAVIPSDLTGYGWADDQNKNLLGLANAIGGLDDLLSALTTTVEANVVKAENDDAALNTALETQIGAVALDLETHEINSGEKFDALDLKDNQLTEHLDATDLTVTNNKTDTDTQIAELLAKINALETAVADFSPAGETGDLRYLKRTEIVELEYVCHDCDVYLAVKTVAEEVTHIYLETDAPRHRRLYVVDETGLGDIHVHAVTAQVSATINGSEDPLVLNNRAAVHLSCGGTTDAGVSEWFIS